MAALEDGALTLAGIAGGLCGSVAGLASLVTYPALLAAGLGPISANATNTVALVFSSVGSTTGSRRELVGQGPRLRRLLPLAVAAGVAGAGLALLTPSGLFAKVVPWLILAAALAIVRRRTEPVAGAPAVADHRAVPVLVGAVGFYGGYFGAAAGVLLLAGLLATTTEPLARANAAKNVLLGAANLAGAVAFVALGPVRWSAAIPLAVGCLVGARAGPAIVRVVPARPLRLAIGGAGVVLASVLAARAY